MSLLSHDDRLRKETGTVSLAALKRPVSTACRGVFRGSGALLASVLAAASRRPNTLKPNLPPPAPLPFLGTPSPLEHRPGWSLFPFCAVFTIFLKRPLLFRLCFFLLPLALSLTFSLCVFVFLCPLILLFTSPPVAPSRDLQHQHRVTVLGRASKFNLFLSRGCL